ncbi:MAG TPA: energy transducer TonB [Bacteroidota bacterium]|jgi:protein TonB|nr:energy transducer TonB [Bacteroidota bacterium]
MTAISHDLERRNSVLPYGRLEIKRLFNRTMSVSLVVSISLHLLLITGYYTREYFAGDDDAPIITVRMMKYSELGPPPSIQQADQVPAVGVTAAVTKPTIGIPVPVPDVEINPEQTIATQQELSQIQSAPVGEGQERGNLAIEKDIQIAPEDDPGMDEFVPVEKAPIPVKQVHPEYPEIARRTGIEGTVWIRALVDKQGKVKKAVVAKSDSELFEAVAIEAALHWLFTPAIMNSGPVTVWIVIPFRFQLNKQTP